MKYNRTNYPDGQVSAIIEEFGGPIVIRERINSYNDLMFVAGLAEVLKHKRKHPYHLEIPCLFGQRSDRRFVDNQSFDLKIICDIINRCDFDTVTLLDPHSDIPLVLINNAVTQPIFPFIKDTVDTLDYDDLVLVTPDAGAYKKHFKLGEELDKVMVGAIKHRDAKGNIHLEFVGDVKDKPCLIIDDLADGGYTFYVLGQELKKRGATMVFLYVTHGMFAKGFDLLGKVIDGIFCTNSYRGLDHPLVIKQYKVV